MFTTTLFGVHDTKMTRVFVMQYEIMAIERVVEYMLKVHKSPSHRLPRIAWEASKKFQKLCAVVGCKIWKYGLVDGMQHTCFMTHH